MSSTTVTAISNVGNQDESLTAPNAFQKTSQNLQAQQLSTARTAANGLDTVKLSGLSQGQQLISDVSVLSHHLRTGDLAAAQSAYRAVRQDVQEQQRQSGDAADNGVIGVPHDRPPIGSAGNPKTAAPVNTGQNSGNRTANDRQESSSSQVISQTTPARRVDLSA